MNKFESPLFNYTIQYTQEYEQEYAQVELVENVVFNKKNPDEDEENYQQIVFVAKNKLPNETLEKYYKETLKSFDVLKHNDNIQLQGKWKTFKTHSSNTLKSIDIFHWKSFNMNGTSLHSFFEINNVFFNVLFCITKHVEDMNEMIQQTETFLKGFNCNKVKQSHKVDTNGVPVTTIVGENWKMRIPKQMKRMGQLYCGEFKYFDDEKPTPIVINVSVDNHSNEKEYKEMMYELWGDIDCSERTFTNNSLQWKIITFMTQKEVYGTTAHCLAYHCYNNTYYTIWFGMKSHHSILMSLFIASLSSFSHDQVIVKDSLPLYYHIEPKYFIHIPESFKPINSAEEYGLISDYLPTLFVNEKDNAHFFISIIPIVGYENETVKQIIRSMIENTKSQAIQMIEQKEEKWNGYWCCNQLMKLEVKQNELQCLVKNIEIPKKYYMRISFSAPENTFEEIYFNCNIPQIISTIEVIDFNETKK